GMNGNAATPCSRLPPRLKRRSAARNRCTTAVRSTCYRSSTRNAHASQCASARTTAIRSCCSTACSFTRLWVEGGRCSSLKNRQPSAPFSPRIHELLSSYSRGTILKTSHAAAFIFVPIATVMSACTSKPAPEALRAVRIAEVRYDKAQETNRYFGSVQARYEVDQGFRVGGKVVTRKVDVGQKVRQGEVLATLDDTDYKLA